jgi:hypothetical protein
MDMFQSEKNALEKLADAIPGLKGYRDKEARRDTDKRLRDYIAGRIDGVRKSIDDTKRTQVEEGKLDGLAEIDRLSQKLRKSADSIRHASYGYSGFFDQVKIREAELDRIYQYDLSLISDIEALENSAKKDPTKTIDEQKRSWEDKIEALDTKIEGRKSLFTTIG